MLPSAVHRLPTPTSSDYKGATTTRKQAGQDRGQLDAVLEGGVERGEIRLLPTPTVNDMGAGKTPDEWDDWTDRMRAEHGNGNGHGDSLSVETLRLFPTPGASDGEGGKTSRSGDRIDEPLLGGIARLLPTPSAADGGDGGRHTSDGFQRTLPGETRLLPTPTSTDAKASGAYYPSTATHSQGTTLTDATVRQPDRWGDYAAAVHRWEAITRPAPDPTQPGSKGAPQLAPRFVEWMMGLPAGHVTDPTIWEGMAGKRGKPATPSAIRNAQLKALGNGVVPPQAAAAIRILARQIIAGTA